MTKHYEDTYDDCLNLHIHKETMNNVIEKQLVPIFHDSSGKPIAILLFLNRQRIIYKIEPADEDEIMALYEQTNPTLNENKKRTDSHTQRITPVIG